MRLKDNEVLVRGTADAHGFREGSARLVAAHPVLHSVLATTLDHAIERPSDYAGARWYWATRGARWLAVAMRTPQRPFHVVTTDPVIARAFAYRLREQGVTVEAVSGLVAGALPFAESWVDLGGAAAISVGKREGLYDLPRAPEPPPGVPGGPRAARADELAVLDAWGRAYAVDNRQPDPGPAPMRPWLDKGGLRVWEVEGRAVAMAYASRPHGGVSRLSWVYTPTEERGRGYASALLAAAGAEQQALGHRVLLYTDLDNQPATALYRRVGFRRIADAAVLRLLTEEPVMSFGTNPLRRPKTPRVTGPEPEAVRARRAMMLDVIRRARRSGRG